LCPNRTRAGPGPVGAVQARGVINKAPQQHSPQAMPYIGDVVAVDFPPGDPELAVWAKTVEGGQWVLLYVGVGVGLLFAGLGR
jgi:hypothetical protein